MELLSPLTDGAAALRQSVRSSADNESGDERVGKGTGNTIARWSSVFTKVCAAVLIGRIFCFRNVLDYYGSRRFVFCRGVDPDRSQILRDWLVGTVLYSDWMVRDHF